ncbi:peptide chain release factor N(5)-glutamine methyltransferase [Thermohalobacter berrensis]|uniref:Release factor glutamine methyltransferase n=1 Tax=Thermohalobacter berrensis TaxID=99594 RepID=A0A419T093_9FIRM|nr:peptide chain release factor N(5)-glutamine methyltransferase [Thermohalobacter berrensis]RKD30882.1 protein-(glutamine-N5) methyltransferase, release factor-specific [Thermohalobacter berrensis]
MTINDLLKKGIYILLENNISNPQLDVELLLSYTLNVDKVYIYTHRDEEVSNESVDNFLKLIDRRKQGYPLQYILKKQEFMGLDFCIEEGVLIPRQDTEVLVEKIINIVNNGHFKDRKVINIVDIGVGSGAISLSLVHYLEKAHVYSIDIDNKAIEITRKNSVRLGLEDKITLLKGNLFSPLTPLNLENKIDIIVSNPPYIPSQDIDTLQVEVAKYEPRKALDGGIDGLDFYRKIIPESIKYLRKDGVLAFEIGYNQGNEVANLIKESGSFKGVEVIKDLAGLDRAVLAYCNK